MSVENKSYSRFFVESWNELENEFRSGNINPQHENDVVCYLYYAFATKLKKKGWPLYLIRTEDTHNIKSQTLRPDLNLNNRLFVEVKMYPLRSYSSGWERKKVGIEYNVKKLEKYVRYTKSKTSIHVRKPILALWFRKRDRANKLPVEDKLIDSELEKRLETEKERLSNKVLIVYGPRRLGNR